MPLKTKQLEPPTLLLCDLKQIRRDMFAVMGVPRGAKVCEDTPRDSESEHGNVIALVTRAAPRFTNNNTFVLWLVILHRGGVGDEVYHLSFNVPHSTLNSPLTFF